MGHEFWFGFFLQLSSKPCFHGKVDSSHVLINSCYCVLAPKLLTHGDFTVTSLNWSPDKKYIAIDYQPDPRIKASGKSDIALVDAVSGSFEKIISHLGPDSFGAWSPDGKELVYSSSLDNNTSNYYKNNHILIYNLNNRNSREIGQDLDEDKSIQDWNEGGIFITAEEKMKTFLWNINPFTNKLKQEKINLDLVNSATFSLDGKSALILGRNFKELSEIYELKSGLKVQGITHLSNQISSWNTPMNEIISWKSQDGTPIEGVLLKPKDYDPHKKYPLLVVIHGGPTGTDRPEPVPTYVYPMMQWCEKGALVLRVNYRGSAGYGEKFRSLNVNNLGVGDMWDVLSGVEFLNKMGIIDTSRLGCMGWSQGGYISAFLTTHTHIFKAISVGAGISDWMTYYANTDITPFTPQYLQSTPWSNPELYQKTSPITTINQASTPTQIQHGELDKRVPIPNAFELYRGLKDRGIPSRLMIYKGFGHGITKPKERLAAVWHNWQWFNHYVFGEPEEKMPID